MKALKKQQIAVILVLSVILSTFAAVTPVSAATLSAQQYLEKMRKKVAERDIFWTVAYWYFIAFCHFFFCRQRQAF